MREKISLQQVLLEIETSQKEINNSKNRIMIFLLASTVIVLFWATSIVRFDLMYMLRLFVSIPFIFNIAAWLFYIFQYFPFFFGNHRFYMEREKDDYDDPEMERLIWHSQNISYSLYKQKKLERIIIPLLAIQFISLLTFLMFIFQIR